ncbi:MAG TPA: DUF4169 family protein [Sphingomonas sp.]|nr:DUF4169 family protein [Sphingomonas sp.]
MAEIVNLNRARKAKRRADSARQAEANRAKFGRTGEEKAREEAEAQRRAALLDGVKREE